MTLNISVEEVPFAILEMVKARILAQRQKQQQQQAKPPTPKGPRPQFRRFGASSKAYRRPQPAAVPTGGAISFVLGPNGNYVDSELVLTTDNIDSMVFSRHGITSGTNGVPIIDFGVTNGPTAGTKTLFPGVFSLGYLVSVHGFAFASSYPSNSPLDMKTAGQPLGGLNMRLNIWSSYPLTDEVITELPELLNSDARAGQYNSYTFEFICQPTARGLAVSFNNALFRFDYFYGLPAVTFDVDLCGIQSVSTSKGELDTDYNQYDVRITSDPRLGPDDPEILIEHMPEGTWSHIALVKDEENIRFYLNGVLMFTAVTTDDYWNRGCTEYSEFTVIRNNYRNGDLPIMFAVTDQTITGSDEGNDKIHGIRFTPEALYTGQSFTPPTSITSLA